MRKLLLLALASSGCAYSTPYVGVVHGSDPFVAGKDTVHYNLIGGGFRVKSDVPGDGIFYDVFLGQPILRSELGEDSRPYLEIKIGYEFLKAN